MLFFDLSDDIPVIGAERHCRIGGRPERPPAREIDRLDRRIRLGHIGRVALFSNERAATQFQCAHRLRVKSGNQNNTADESGNRHPNEHV
ncbi:MAG: hypothetical protein DMF56_21060 [Acidobacteria bacterium]|nr:MAG: hypothetical protein DMF56_21060 [Acidobacteriota bacterium]